MYWVYSEVQVEVQVCKIYFNWFRSNLITRSSATVLKNSVIYQLLETVASRLATETTSISEIRRYHRISLAWVFARPVWINIVLRSRLTSVLYRSFFLPQALENIKREDSIPRTTKPQARPITHFLFFFLFCFWFRTWIWHAINDQSERDSNHPKGLECFGQVHTDSF